METGSVLKIPIIPAIWMAGLQGQVFTANLQSDSISANLFMSCQRQKVVRPPGFSVRHERVLAFEPGP